MTVSSAESQFDGLADLYEDMAEWPFRKEIEIPSILHRLGDLTQRDVLDFGCGSGLYSRMLKSLGARRVVGFDEAEGMLGYARRREEKERLGLEFTSELSDAFNHQFDVVLGVYVLPYATTREALREMCADMARGLRPGGRLLTLPIHPAYVGDPDYYRPYGFRLISDTPHADGCSLRLELRRGPYEANVTAWYWSTSSLEDAMRAAGFTSIQWHDPRPPGVAVPEDAPPELRAYLRKPHAAMLDCRMG